jgi:hypothetical protein
MMMTTTTRVRFFTPLASGATTRMTSMATMVSTTNHGSSRGPSQRLARNSGISSAL